MIKLDYTIESPEERKALVEQIIEETPNISPAYLEILANYLVIPFEKQEKKAKKILTDNRLTTVNKRECSYEDLAGQLENGEDGIYNLMNDNKHTIFRPKISITQHDLDAIPFLRQLRETINQWEDALKRASGKDAYIIKKAIIEMRKEQYIIKQAYTKPVVPCRLTHSTRMHSPLNDESTLDIVPGQQPNLNVQGISLMDRHVIEAILCNYSKLKEDSYDQFRGDVWYLIQAFEEVCDKALENFPIYQRIVELKIDKRQNREIQQALQEEFGETYTVEYISSLWRNKIPRTIAVQAQEDFITYEYERRNFPMKKCTKCGRFKPAHNRFFSRNSTSKDQFYSICKKCRNERERKKGAKI